MKKLRFFFLFIAALNSHALFAQPKAVILDYIERFKDIAMTEMARTGVPASITLAQGIHETGAGTSQLVIKSNNHFGIKCKTEWTGEKVYHDDDARGECFRKYDDPVVSYKDHSDFLRTRSHYASLFTLDPEDYESWAHGLKKAGYATNPKYPQILIKLIRDYNLQDYTLIALGKKEYAANEPVWANAKPTEKPDVVTIKKTEAQTASMRLYPQGVFSINDTKVIAVAKGTSYLMIAEEYNISLARLFEFNDMKDGDVAREDGLMFLQRKRKTGAQEIHLVVEGETLYQVSQTEGIRLESLLQLNFLTAGAQVLAGEKLYLKDPAPARPRLTHERVTALMAAPSRALFTETGKDEHEPRTVVHVVQPKETVYSIARRYEVEVDEVRKWNDLETADIKIGQQIKINKTR